MWYTCESRRKSLDRMSSHSAMSCIVPSRHTSPKTCSSITPPCQSSTPRLSFDSNLPDFMTMSCFLFLSFPLSFLSSFCLSSVFPSFLLSFFPSFLFLYLISFSFEWRSLIHLYPHILSNLPLYVHISPLSNPCFPSNYWLLNNHHHQQRSKEKGRGTTNTTQLIPQLLRIDATRDLKTEKVVK